MAKTRKPGLWLRTVSIEAVDVTNRMKRLCDTCGAIPTERRLDVKLGSGRNATLMVMCPQCALEFVDGLKGEAERMADYVSGASDDSVREDAAFMLADAQKTVRARAAERKRLKEEGR